MQQRKSADCLEFQGLFSKRLLVNFDTQMTSSDGGAVLLRAADQKLGLITCMADALLDRRQGGKLRYSTAEMLSQRIFAIACGHADCNDAARLSFDPLHRLLARGNAGDPGSLASQPTLSRFENSMGWKDLHRLAMSLLERIIDHHRNRLSGRARMIMIDMDPTEDPTHGAQQLSFFNGHYDNWCYLPMICNLTFNNEAEQYLCAAVLRPGSAPAKLGAIGILKRILPRLRAAFPGARLRIRLDGGFAAPEIFDYLEAENLEYAVNMAKNSILKQRAGHLMKKAQRLSRESGCTEYLFGETSYAAGSWGKKRRVVIKAEVTRLPGREPRDNPRFVVTNFRQSPEYVYKKIYCRRGDSENRIKELKDGAAIDRTSCCRFKANQFRVLLSMAAYVLVQEIRHAAKGTEVARFQMTNLQIHLFKLGARIVESTRRIVLHLPQSFPYLEAFRKISLALGATS